MNFFFLGGGCKKKLGAKLPQVFFAISARGFVDLILLISHLMAKFH